jgi:hypothetical protein
MACLLEPAAQKLRLWTQWMPAARQCDLSMLLFGRGPVMLSWLVSQAAVLISRGGFAHRMIPHPALDISEFVL